MVLFGSFSQHSHLRRSESTLRPKENTSIVMTLTHFVLHCHLSLRLPTSNTVSLREPGYVRTVIWPGKKASAETEFGRQEESPSIHWPRVLFAGVQGRLTKGDDGLGRRHTHTHTPVPGGAPAAVRWGKRWRRGLSRGRQTCRRQGPHRALAQRPVVGDSSRWTKGITVISKYFWSLYKLSLLWQHFSKLESQTKGTFMLECRRVTNS